MSLDVDLLGPEEAVTCTCSECGNQHGSVRRERLYADSITHNLARMAGLAAIYMPLWHPDEMFKAPRASDLIEPLRAGLQRLLYDPELYRTLNPSNGCGNYDDLVRFVESYLAACEEHPDAIVEVSR